MMPLDPMKVSAIGSSTGFSHTPQPRRPEHAEGSPAIRLIYVALRLFPRDGSDLKLDRRPVTTPRDHETLCGEEGPSPRKLESM